MKIYKEIDIIARVLRSVQNRRRRELYPVRRPAFLYAINDESINVWKVTGYFFDCKGPINYYNQKYMLISHTEELLYWIKNKIKSRDMGLMVKDSLAYPQQSVYDSFYYVQGTEYINMANTIAYSNFKEAVKHIKKKRL